MTEQLPPPRTNGFAIASLVLGIIGASLFGLIFGFVALSQIRERGESGRKLALGGIWASIAWVVVCCLFVGALAMGGVIFGDKNPPAAASSGTCVNGIDDPMKVIYPTVDCGKPHDAELTAKYQMSSSDKTYPSDSFDSAVKSRCHTLFEDYADPKFHKDPLLSFYQEHPTTLSWETGDREIACYITGRTGQLTGSVKRGAATAVHASGPKTKYFDELEPGECINEAFNDDLIRYTLVACEQPHDAEVVAVFQVDNGPYPGRDLLSDMVRKQCGILIDTYATPQARKDAYRHWWFPSSSGWADGDRDALCTIVGKEKAKITGSVRAA